jgi:Protein of unknown function (DUF998)
VIRNLRVGVLATTGAAVGLVILLHVLSDRDPIRTRLSEYAVDRWGPLMVAAFVFLAIAVALLGVFAIVSGERMVARGGGGALIIAGAAILVAGLSPTDPGAATAAEELHARSSAVATVIIVCVAVAWAFSVVPSVAARASAGLAVILLLASVMLHESTVSGLSQRILWADLIVWVVTASRSLGRAGARSG